MRSSFNTFLQVLHLTTAAAGAEAFYTSENNPSRTEGVEEARVLDKKIRDAWLGHPHHIVFSNDEKENGGKGFEAKLRSLIDHVSHMLGLPTVSNVNITIYDVLGKKVATIVNEKMEPGYYFKTWNSNNKYGNEVAAGLYFYQIIADGFTKTRKLVLLK